MRSKQGRKLDAQSGNHALMKRMPLCEDTIRSKIKHGSVVDLGKGPVLAIKNTAKKGAFYLMPWQACNIALSQMRSERSEDFDFLDIVQDFATYRSGQTIRLLKYFTELQAEGFLPAFVKIMAEYIEETQRIVADAKRNYVHMPPNIKRIATRFDALELVEEPVNRPPSEKTSEELNPEEPEHESSDEGPKSGSEITEATKPESEKHDADSVPAGEIIEAQEPEAELQDVVSLDRKATMIELADEIYSLSVRERKLFRAELASRLQKRFPKNRISDVYLADLILLAYECHPDLYELRTASPVSKLIETIHTVVTENPKISNTKLKELLEKKHPNNSFSGMRYIRLLISKTYGKYPELKKLRKSMKATVDELADASYPIVLKDPGMERQTLAIKLRKLYPDNSISVAYMGNILFHIFKKHPEFRVLRETALEAKKTEIKERSRTTPLAICLLELIRQHPALFNSELAQLASKKLNSKISIFSVKHILIDHIYPYDLSLKELRKKAITERISRVGSQDGTRVNSE